MRLILTALLRSYAIPLTIKYGLLNGTARSEMSVGIPVLRRLHRAVHSRN